MVEINLKNIIVVQSILKYSKLSRDGLDRLREFLKSSGFFIQQDVSSGILFGASYKSSLLAMDEELNLKSRDLEDLNSTLRRIVNFLREEIKVSDLNLYFEEIAEFETGKDPLKVVERMYDKSFFKNAELEISPMGIGFGIAINKEFPMVLRIEAILRRDVKGYSVSTSVSTKEKFDDMIEYCSKIHEDVLTVLRKIENPNI
ncbi:MAG: hypothetical protein J7L50_01805 [Candidatus Odinarchaeota archaeon]|nr:hypothetical protein [Candidatus Odinarchaeota archaeon]